MMEMATTRFHGLKYRIHLPTKETKDHAKKVLEEKVAGEEVQLTGRIWAVKTRYGDINYYETY